MSKYVVCGNMEYYPDVEEFDILEEAKASYEERDTHMEDVFLCEIIEVKRDSSDSDKKTPFVGVGLHGSLTGKLADTIIYDAPFEEETEVNHSSDTTVRNENGND